MAVLMLGPVGGICRTPLKVVDSELTIQNETPFGKWLNLVFSILQQVGPLVVNGAFMIQLGQVPVYANNAAAIAGGLNPGNLYRTGANPDPVCIVH